MSQKMDLQVGDDAGRVGGGDGLVICGWRGQEGGGEREGRWICVGAICRWRGQEADEKEERDVDLCGCYL